MGKGEKITASSLADDRGGFDELVRRQHALLAQALAAGMPRAGWKVCVNERRTQQRLGLDGVFFGFLQGSRRFGSGEACMVEEGAMLGVEPELAILFGAPVSRDDSREAMRAAIAGVAPALEIVNYRGAKLDLETMVVASSFQHGFVVGEPRPLLMVPRIGEGCPVLRLGGVVIGSGDSALVPADLTDLVAAGAAFLAPFGQALEAGDWLLCGACTAPARVEAGDEVEADFGSLGKTRVRFVA